MELEQAIDKAVEVVGLQSLNPLQRTNDVFCESSYRFWQVFQGSTSFWVKQALSAGSASTVHPYACARTRVSVCEGLRGRVLCRNSNDAALHHYSSL